MGAMKWIRIENSMAVSPPNTHTHTQTHTCTHMHIHMHTHMHTHSTHTHTYTCTHTCTHTAHTHTYTHTHTTQKVTAVTSLPLGCWVRQDVVDPSHLDKNGAIAE